MDHALPDAADFPLAGATASPAATLALGERAASRLRGGEVLLLWGPLGAGKTVFVQGVCRGLAVPDDEVVSPTFTLVHTYAGRLTVHHLDLYRLGADDDLHDVGVDALLDETEAGGAVLLVEWPGPLLPWLDARLELLALPGDGPDQRRWRLRGVPATPPAWGDLFTEDQG